MRRARFRSTAGRCPSADSRSLAAQLLGRLTSPSRAVMRAEIQIKIQDALNAMDPIDREILALRHFEELSNSETAAVLGIAQGRRQQPLRPGSAAAQGDSGAHARTW